MSVINRMLQDLDRRQAVAPGVPFGTVSAVPPARHNRWLGLLTTGLFLTSVAVIAVWVSRNAGHGVEPSTPASARSVQVQQVAPVRSEESTQQNDIKQVDIQQAAHSLRLNLASAITTTLTLVKQAHIGKAGTHESEPPAPAVARSALESTEPAPSTPAAVASSDPEIIKISTPDESSTPRSSTTVAVETAAPTTAPLNSVVHKQLSQDPAAMAERAYQVALVHLQRGENEDAERELARAHALQPEHAGVIAALATLYLQQVQLDKAEALLAPALAAAPDNANVRLLLARARLASGKPNEAWQLLREHTPVLQGNTDYHAVLAALEQQLGHGADAAARYNALLAIDSTQGAWWLGLGLAMESQQRRKEAADAYRHALVQSTLPAAAREYAAARVAALGDR